MRIRKKLTISMLITALLPLVISMGLALWHSTEQTTKLTLDAAQGRLGTASQKLSRYFSERIAEVSTYSQTKVMKTMDFSKIRPFLLSELARHNKIYEKFILGTTEGYFYNTSGGNPGVGGLRTFNDRDANAKPKHIRKRDYWQQTVGRNSVAKQVSYVSEPMISYTTGAKQIVVASTILSAEGKVKGMIGGALPWTDIQKRIKQVNYEISNQLGWEAKFFLLSNKGTYWYHWDPQYIVHLKLDDAGKPILNEIGEKVVIKKGIQDETIPEMVSAGAKMMNGESGYTSFMNPDTGKFSYLVFSHIPSANYSIGLVVPRNQIMAAVENLQFMFISIFLAAAIFVVLVALIFSRKISISIVSLNKMAKEISQGNWKLKLKPEGRDEIRELTESFNTMSESLERREYALKQSEERLEKINTELEQRITKRTQELETTNERLKVQMDERNLAELALRSSEELLKNTGHLAHVGGWKLDVLQGDLSWTEETFRIHGLSSDKHIDLETAITYFAAESQHRFKSAIEQAIEKASAFDLELLLIDKQENQAWVRVICHVREEAGKVVELVGAYQDISELKKVEHLKNELVSTVSHELRTPLTSIRGSLSLLKSGKVAKVDQAAIQLLDIAERNSERLMLLINDILDMEKIRSGKMDYSWSHCSLIQLLEQSLAENELFSKKFDITYKLHPHTPDVTINVDKERFLQVMSNLLSNATKFSTVGTTVDISGELSNQGQVCVSVQDYGQGIPESFREKIFTKFSQADSSDTRKQGGTGLGLSISKSIIEHMDGEIAYDTVVGKGTTFYITLPIVEEETKQRVS